METKEIDVRDEKDLSIAIGNADVILNKSYLSALSKAHIVEQYPMISDNREIMDGFSKNVRFFDITQIVLNKNENMRDKLVTVFNSVGATNSSVLMHIQGNAEKVSIHFGIKSADDKKTMLSQETLEKNLRANFPGSIFKNCDKSSLKTDILDSLSFNGTVSSVTDIAGLRFEEETKERQFMQGIEKLIDTLQGETYSILLIADPVSLSDLNASRRALENLYSSLMPFSESQLSVGANETDTVNQSITKSVTDTVNESITDTVTHTVGKSESVTDGKNSSININPGALKGAATLAGAVIGQALIRVRLVGAGIGAAVGGAIGGALGVVSFSKGKNHSETHGTNESDSNAHGTTSGSSHAEGESNTEGTSQAVGSSQNLQIKFENHTVKQIMERIDETLKRYNTCADLGMWNCAVYCISESEYVSQMAASVYQSLIRGKNSSLENGSITHWNKDQSKLLINSLKRMSHPLLDLNGVTVTPGTLVSSAELAIHAGLPNHSVPGIPVIECAEFGRTVSSYSESNLNRQIYLGHIFNMHAEEKLRVDLDANSLASHAFITGSTGSGKSNTVYTILSKLKTRGINFLVVEPAKGEYKNVFGNNPDVCVYGTNPNLTPLLRINPFSFPHGNEDETKNIHILEHLDRLIEIFNVCWPMYAAMPAVLKEAVEKAYEDCGWDLTESINEYGNDLYPTFADVTRNIRTIIDSSEYDAENKGAYKGSLITRLKSLTNGINGLIFTTDEISSKELLDENVVVDLSRVGSSETKSLIMGLLVLKLQEYRMTSGNMNAPLRHVTVLEEAHNLLRRTNTEQSQESGNLQGKSVEMLTNSIAEMRTYGEGFIIADQAPALLDMAVIRNTNTKIIMRLPDQDDRKLVGKAANLNDDQITELAKLPCGVAAVYQNEWVEPVLCKVEKFEKEGNYKYKKPSDSQNLEKQDLTGQEKLMIAQLLFNGTALPDFILNDLANKNLSARSKAIIYAANRNTENGIYEKEDTITGIVFAELYKKPYAKLLDVCKKTSNFDEMLQAYSPLLENEIQEKELRDKIFTVLVVNLFLNELHNSQMLEDWNKKFSAR